MKVNRLMTRKLITVDPESTLKEAARLMIESNVSGLPVVDSDGRLVGIVTEADVVHQEALRNQQVTIKSLLGWRMAPTARTTDQAMTDHVMIIGPDSDHTEAARLMESSGVKRLPVVDDEGNVVGIISRSDILKAFGRADSEIHNEIELNVLERILWLERDAIGIAVTEGKVVFDGRVPTRSDTRILEEMTKRVDGVVDVDAGRVVYDIDDTHGSR